MTSYEYLHINNCGFQDLYGFDSGSLRPRGRPDYHILYITEGTCFLNMNGKSVEAKSGSVILFLPYETQDYRFKGEIHSKSYFIHFFGSVCHELLDGYTERVFYIGKNSKLERLFDTMIDEFQLKLLSWESACQGQLLNIISLISREINLIRNNSNVTSNSKIMDICNVMYSNYSKEVTIPEYALMCNLSESRFSHLFKKNTGVSPIQYILNIRIEKAKELLENTDLSVAEISDMTGMQSQHYFSRIFKKYTNMSPTEYRRIQKGL